MVARINVARTLNFDLDNGYEVEIVFIPAELADDHPLRERHDAGSIAVPATAGSLWMTLFTAGDQHYVGAAIFAADDVAVRCDTIDVRPQFRRRGLASCLYELAGSLFDAPIVPGALLSADAIAFWRARLASKLEAGPC